MLLHVLLLNILAFVVSTSLVDGSATTPRVCSDRHDDVQIVYSRINRKAMRCLTDIDLEQLGTQSEQEVVFKNVCNKKQQVRDCLADVVLTSEVCLTAEYHQIFMVYRELLEATMDSVCVDNGQTLTLMISTFKSASRSPLESNPLLNCVTVSIAGVVFLADEVIAHASRFFLLYREQMNAQKCFNAIDEEYVNEQQQNIVTNIKSILSEITNKMKCIHPQDGSTVLCKTIDVTMPDVPRVCPIKSQDEKMHPLNDKLIDMLDMCLVSSFHPPSGNWSAIDSFDKARPYVKHYCGKKGVVAQCFSNVVAFSSVFLDETQHNLVRVLDDLVHNVLHYGCPLDDSPVAHLLFKVLTGKNKTEGNRGVHIECLDAAQHLDDRSAKGVNVAKMLMYYQQLKVFKECFVNKVRGDNTATSTARSFLNSVQWNMKCIDPVNGNIVLCETIENTPHTSFKVCPFVGEDDNENEPPEYDTFVNQGFACSGASPRTDFSSLYDFSEIEEFRIFFSTFCHNRQPVKYCFDDLSSLSEICLNRTNRQMLGIFTDYLGSVLEVACKRDGDVFATIMHGFMTSDPGVANQMSGCFRAVAFHRMDTNLSVGGLSARTLGIFSALDGLKECFTRGFADGSLFKTVFVESVNEVAGTLKCIHPDGRTVLCGTIEKT